MRCCTALLFCLYLLPAEAQPGNTQLLRYLRCDGQYYLVSIDAQRVRLFPLGPAPAIDSLAGDYINSIQKQAAKPGTGHQLYRALIPETLPPRSRLVICADGYLGHLPFECLVTDTGGNKPGYLVQQTSILYTQNLQAFLDPAQSPAPATRRLLALAPALQRNGMAPLPYAAREAKEALSIHPANSTLLRNISKADFLELVPQYDILHLATHAQSDPNDLGRSCFFLGAAGKPDTVYADELRGLHLRTQLLILSACESANGLAQAFQQAGAHNVLAATWKLPDKCSDRIIRDFYRHLGAGCDKARALQLAKLDYLASADALGAEPWCWAGLVLYGDHNPMCLQAASPKLALLFDGLICLVAAAAYYLSKKYIPARPARAG